MKKVLILGLIVLSTTGAFAYSGECVGGKKITCVNGTYCLSDFAMTWWSAHSWCQSNGGTLITLQDLEDATTKAYTNCVGTKYSVWTANPNGSDRAFNVNLNSGTLYNTNSRRGSENALCK